MYKVLLVDDEPMALEVLKYVLEWEKLGFSICGECENGKKGIEAIDKYDPDVVITDIKMPVMDGLDLIRYAEERGKKSIKFIVVSGYGEFEYAKKAMQYGVRYYLQKPIFDEEIYGIVVEIRKQLDQMHKKQESAEMDKKAILDSALYNLLRGSDMQEACNYLGVFLDKDILLSKWKCIVIELEAYDELDINDGFRKMRLNARQAIDKTIKNDSGVFVLEHSSNIFIILVSLVNDECYSDEKIYNNLVTTVNSGFTIGVGANVADINDVKHSYTTALTAIKHKFYNGLNCLIYYDEIKEKTFDFEFNDIFMSNKVLEAVEEFDNRRVKNVINTTFEYFEIHRINPDIVRMFTSNMIYKLNNLICKSGDKVYDFADNHTIRELKEHGRTMEELKQFFESFCVRCCEYLKKMHSKNSESNMAKIETFIKENYKRNITIRELAKNVYMHPAYLGQLFIRKFGIGFNEYVHKLRIEEAKRLMNGTTLKDREIAEGVGYSNYNSFLQQFQKYTGMKPTKFRSMYINL